MQNQIQIITSRDLASDVVDRLKLYDDPEFNPGLAQPSLVDLVGEMFSLLNPKNWFENITPAFGDAYNASWFAKEPGLKPLRATDGYQAPPLDGVWATAPYFHNGSVPTLDGVLNSAARPEVFTRSFRTAEADYDAAKVGWRVTEVPPPDAKLPGHERRKVYDTTQPGRSNAGHTYGDDLTADERRAVIEYLKTL